MRWSFIGGGNMASSLIGGLLQNGTRSDAIQVLDVDAAQREAVSARFGVRCISTTQDIGAEDVVVIAVKPNHVKTVCESFKANDPSQQPALVMSVAAGVTATAMQGWLPDNTAIVRTMPNTPALLGLGATALYANAACTPEHKHRAEQLMQAAGTTVWVEAESQLDAVTALSGSGPAYFFYLIEHMAQAAIDLGLSPQTANQLAVQTALGAASMAKEAGCNPAELRQQVTSKGGTTHAAITTFDEHKLPDTVKAAMQAAHDRAIELGKEFGE